jgi:hypothetical protein
MNRELGSRKIKGFQSNNEARATGNVARVSSPDRTPNAFPGVGFSRFIAGLASRFIIGLACAEPR